MGKRFLEEVNTKEEVKPILHNIDELITKT